MQGDHQTQPFIIAAVRIDEMLGTDVLGYLRPERAVWQPRTRRRCRSRCKVAAAPSRGHAEVPIAIIMRHGPAAVRVDELGGRVLRELLRRAQHRRRDAEAGGEADRPLGPA